MSSRPELRLDWCSHEAEKYAVEHWHYSRCMPAGKMVRAGAWEGGRYIGCVLFSRGANNHIGSQYKLSQVEVCELTRVALTAHYAPVSRIVAIAVKMMRTLCPGLRLIVSYADPEHDHHGGIYQAMGWLYSGKQQGQTEYLWNGRQWHGRSVTASGRGTTRGLPKVKVSGKHLYLMPLDDAMRVQIEPLRKPYPKREKQATDVPTSSGGAAPTLTLQNHQGAPLAR